MTIGLVTLVGGVVHVSACMSVAFNDNAAYHNEWGCSWMEAPSLTRLKVISANAAVFAICWDCLHLPR